MEYINISILSLNAIKNNTASKRTIYIYVGRNNIVLDDNEFKWTYTFLKVMQI